MHPALMQDLAATIAADRRREGERARAADAVAARGSRLSRALRWPRRTAAPVSSPGARPGATRVVSGPWTRVQTGPLLVILWSLPV